MKKSKLFRCCTLGATVLSVLGTVATTTLISEPAYACVKPRGGAGGPGGGGNKIIIRLPNGTIIVINGRGVRPDGTIDPDIGVPIDLFAVTGPTQCDAGIGFGQDPNITDFRAGIFNTSTGDFNEFLDDIGNPIFDLARTPDRDDDFLMAGDPSITEWHAFQGIIESFDPSQFPLNGVDEDYVAFFTAPDDPVSTFLETTIQIASGSGLPGDTDPLVDPTHPVAFTEPVKNSVPEPGTVLGLLAISGLGLGLKHKKQK